MPFDISNAWKWSAASQAARTPTEQPAGNEPKAVQELAPDRLETIYHQLKDNTYEVENLSSEEKKLFEDWSKLNKKQLQHVEGKTSTTLVGAIGAATLPSSILDTIFSVLGISLSGAAQLGISLLSASMSISFGILVFYMDYHKTKKRDHEAVKNLKLANARMQVIKLLNKRQQEDIYRQYLTLYADLMIIAEFNPDLSHHLRHLSNSELNVLTNDIISQSGWLMTLEESAKSNKQSKAKLQALSKLAKFIHEDLPSLLKDIQINEDTIAPVSLAANSQLDPANVRKDDKIKTKAPKIKPKASLGKMIGDFFRRRHYLQMFIIGASMTLSMFGFIWKSLPFLINKLSETALFGLSWLSIASISAPISIALAAVVGLAFGSYFVVKYYKNHEQTKLREKTLNNINREILKLDKRYLSYKNNLINLEGLHKKVIAYKAEHSTTLANGQLQVQTIEEDQNKTTVQLVSDDSARIENVEVNGNQIEVTLISQAESAANNNSINQFETNEVLAEKKISSPSQLPLNRLLRFHEDVGAASQKIPLLNSVAPHGKKTEFEAAVDSLASTEKIEYNHYGMGSRLYR